MNFSFNRVKSLRIFLFPFSLIYAVVVICRNFLFDRKIIRSVSFDLPIIAVGNLSVGGTGKSPMVEYLLLLLKDKYRLATLSRGYKRKTKGYVLAKTQTTAHDIGDEPTQFFRKFQNVAVAVGEERILAIPQLLQDRPEIDVIILDDAFQHRSIKAGLNILLTGYRNLFTRDFFLPTGDLRDQKSSYKRADLIIVTKCPFNLSEQKGTAIRIEINPLPHQKVFFTATEYGTPYHIVNGQQRTIGLNDKVLLVRGVANPSPLKEYISANSKTISALSFSDHHIFTSGDIRKIIKRFNSIDTDEKIIITTEKDAIRLVEFGKELEDVPLFVLPVRHRFLFSEGVQSDCIVNTFIEKFRRDNK